MVCDSVNATKETFANAGVAVTLLLVTTRPDDESGIDLKAIGKRIGVLLEELQISQAELARRMYPVAKSTVSNWVQGKRLIQTEGLFRLLQIAPHGVTAHEILFGGEDHVPFYGGESLTSEDWKELFSAPEAASLTVRDRYYIRNLLEGRPDKGLASVIVKLLAAHPMAESDKPTK